MSFIQENLATIIVGAVVLCVVILVVVSMRRRKRKGKGSCDCGCKTCPYKDKCE